MNASTSIQRTILVVEDHDDSRQMMKILLELDGYRVITAATGGRAVQMATQYQPDLIVMDISLPDFDGITATRLIRRETALKRVPIIALTAYDMDESRALALEAGCTEFMLKPVDLDQLEAAFKRLIGGPKGNTNGEDKVGKRIGTRPRGWQTGPTPNRHARAGRPGH